MALFYILRPSIFYILGPTAFSWGWCPKEWGCSPPHSIRTVQIPLPLSPLRICICWHVIGFGQNRYNSRGRKDKTGAAVLGFLDGNFFWQESDCSYLVQPLLSARERPLSCHVFSSLKKQDLKWDIKGWNQVSFGHQLPLGQKLPHHEWASYKSCSVLEAGDISLPTFRSVKQQIAQLENALKEKSFTNPTDQLFWNLTVTDNGSQLQKKRKFLGKRHCDPVIV